MDMLESRLGVGLKFHQRSVNRRFGGVSALFIKTSPAAGVPYPRRRHRIELLAEWLVLLKPPENIRTIRHLGAAALLTELLYVIRLCLLSVVAPAPPLIIDGLTTSCSLSVICF
ncbi:hypothetical protein PanWU01x14_251300 [Parasponia andersonii]|uniref:Uncharacterized protein n=1 Tax=Parasponia andersonii TaxID=3476 RepID=A0A2P5BCG2_PARAD|nr:hypothetical protein PanWU01x14_251300 [Parasponia andersonii]